MHASTPRSALDAAASSARVSERRRRQIARVEKRRSGSRSAGRCRLRTVGDCRDLDVEVQVADHPPHEEHPLAIPLAVDGDVRPHEVEQLRLDREQAVEVERARPALVPQAEVTGRSPSSSRCRVGRDRLASGAKTMSTPSDSSRSARPRPACAGTRRTRRACANRSGFTKIETTTMSARSRARR